MTRVERNILALCDKYDNALGVFSGAYFAEEAIQSGDLATFCEFLPGVVTNAKFFKWHEGVAGALRRFCRLCLVDPALVEVYLGMKFEEVAC